jgi:hypothetical protein
MKHRGIAVLRAVSVVVLGCGLCLSAIADTEKEAQTYIQKAYDRMAAAESRNDTEGSMSYWTSDFRMYDSKIKNDKGMNREEYKKAATGYKGMKSYKEKDVIVKFILKGDIATATMTSKRRAKMVNKEEPDKVLDVVGEGRSVDTWVKTPKGWRKKKAVTFYHHTVVNGEWIGDN